MVPAEDGVYLGTGGPAALDGLTPGEVAVCSATLSTATRPQHHPRLLQVVRAFANWALREGFPVDPAVVRMRPPKVPETELETYNPAKQEAILAAAAPGWPSLAVQILLGTGMRVGELAALAVEDYESDGDVAFLKVRKGKGAKFRRVPILLDCDGKSTATSIATGRGRDQPALVRADGQPIRMVRRVLLNGKAAGGFQVHAHKFRHTFATEYLRKGGDIERLRRILGHSSYVMVMRYLHLDKGDLGKDFDLRSPF